MLTGWREQVREGASPFPPRLAGLGWAEQSRAEQVRLSPGLLQSFKVLQRARALLLLPASTALPPRFFLAPLPNRLLPIQITTTAFPPPPLPSCLRFKNISATTPVHQRGRGGGRNRFSRTAQREIGGGGGGRLSHHRDHLSLVQKNLGGSECSFHATSRAAAATQHVSLCRYLRV